MASSSGDCAAASVVDRLRLEPKLSKKQSTAAGGGEAKKNGAGRAIASEMTELPDWNENSDLSGVRAVVFDAVGTLIRPEPSVAAIYSEVGRRHGAELTQAEVRARVPDAFARHFGSRARRPDAGAPSSETAATSITPQTSSPAITSDELERERWRHVVMDVFHEWPQAGGALFDELWDHFSRGANWRLFDEVEEVWKTLMRGGRTLAIGSNFDRRLIRLCGELPPLDTCRWIFPSSQVGYPKPELGFFRSVEQALGLAPHELLLVGDDFRNDIEGAVAAGWHARWVHRDNANTTRGWLDLRPLLAR